MLAAHNAVRAAVKTRPLVWSDKLRVAAQDWAKVLITRRGLIHSKKSKYGDNMYEMTGGKSRPKAVVKVWFSEAADYAYKTNRCRTACGHDTQVIWRDTKELGCAVARRGSCEVRVCEYSPPGNYVGERPY
jgi:pathogenesis-related protein 1